MTNKQRRERDAALGRLLDTLEEQLYPKVCEAIDFERLDAIQAMLVLEIDGLIAAGKIPPAPNRKAIEARAASMIGVALAHVSFDPRRKADGGNDDCELCRAFGAAPFGNGLRS